ncbi:hypothetical protein ACFX12_030907 [Malus domestica]
MRFTSIWRSMLMLVVLMIWRSATRLCNFVPSLAVMIRPLRCGMQLLGQSCILSKVMILPCILCALITNKMSIFSFQNQ